MSGPLQQRFYPETEFGGYSEVDGTVAFYSRVAALLRDDDVVLDVGCGRGRYGEDPVPLRRNLRVFKGRCARAIGIDLDAAAAENPFLDEFRPMAPGRPWPVESESVDLLVSDCVLEHVDDPAFFFAECERVLKPGGHLCLRTPNKWNYFAIVARCVPNRLHARVLRGAGADRKEEDVFPTRYRCNTRRSVLRMLARHGFDRRCVWGYDAEPGYLVFSKLAYFLGVLHQRFAPRMFRAVLFVFARKALSGVQGAGPGPRPVEVGSVSTPGPVEARIGE